MSVTRGIDGIRSITITASELISIIYQAKPIAISFGKIAKNFCWNYSMISKEWSNRMEYLLVHHCKIFSRHRIDSVINTDCLVKLTANYDILI